MMQTLSTLCARHFPASHTTPCFVKSSDRRHRRQAGATSGFTSSAGAPAVGWGGLAGGLAEELASGLAGGRFRKEAPSSSFLAATGTAAENVVGDELFLRKEATSTKIDGRAGAASVNASGGARGGSWRDKLKAAKAAKVAKAAAEAAQSGQAGGGAVL